MTNEAAASLAGMFSKLREGPDGGLAALYEITTSECVSARIWAATHLLSLDEKFALDQLEKDAKLPGILGFEAKLVLREWHAGRLHRGG